MKARIAISVDRPVRDVFEALAPRLGAAPALATPPDSFNVDERTSAELLAVVAESAGHKLTARYVFGSGEGVATIDCAYEVSGSLLGGNGKAKELLQAWLQQDIQRIPTALREMVTAEAERERADLPEPAPGETAPRRVTARLDIKMKVQIPPGLKLDASRIDPTRAEPAR